MLMLKQFCLILITHSNSGNGKY